MKSFKRDPISPIAQLQVYSSFYKELFLPVCTYEGVTYISVSILDLQHLICIDEFTWAKMRVRIF